MSDARVERLAMTYRLLGDPTRLRIIQALATVEMCVCDIAASLGISESAVSHQLRRLREMSVVQKRRQGQILYYSLCDDRWAMLVSAGEALLDAPRPQPIETRQ
jgi:DNA-binding transcriptional ArsR family regulator